MFFLPSIRRHPEFRRGMQATASVAPGIAAWGLMTGVAMVKAGMSIVEAVAMTVLVYAGSDQGRSRMKKKQRVSTVTPARPTITTSVQGSV